MLQRFFLFMTMLCVPAVAAAQPAYTNYYWGGYLGGVVSADADGESANVLDPSVGIDLRPGSDFYAWCSGRCDGCDKYPR